MKSFESIKDAKEFAKLYKDAKKWYCEVAVIFFDESEAQSNLAVIASKKVGKAVARNRAKRLLRAAFSGVQSRLKCGKYILVAKAEILDMPFVRVQKNIEWGLKKLECFKQVR